MSVRSLPAAALLAAIPFALPAQSIRNITQGSAIRDLWKPIVAEANRSVVEVCVNERAMVLGTVVGKDLVVTKMSELTLSSSKDNESVELSIDQGEETWPCVQIGVDRAADIALLRVTDAELTPVRWRQKEEPVPGSFLASVDGSDAPFGVGILAAASYVHTVPRAFLGIRFANPNGGTAEIEDTVEHGAAEAAGILGGDVVVKFGEAKIGDTDSLRAAIRACTPGDKVSVTLKRGEETVTVEVVLGTNTSPMRSDQESVWGELSDVRSGFQRVLQHDTVLKPEDCGGPIVDLTGAVVGVNVARAGRIETLALPAADVRALVAKLLKGATREGDGER